MAMITITEIEIGMMAIRKEVDMGEDRVDMVAAVEVTVVVEEEVEGGIMIVVVVEAITIENREEDTTTDKTIVVVVATKTEEREAATKIETEGTIDMMTIKVVIKEK